jgi:hypothetical protein
MKRFLEFRSRRFGYDGWALRVRKADKPMDWTVCTTRAEVRALRREKFAERDLFQKVDVVKVRVTVEVVGG